MYLVIVQIKCEADYDEFLRDFRQRLEIKYGTIVITLKKYKPIFYLEKSMLDLPDISFLEKKKEKIVQLKTSNWAYYLPADWIRYPIKDA